MYEGIPPPPSPTPFPLSASASVMRWQCRIIRIKSTIDHRLAQAGIDFSRLPHLLVAGLILGMCFGQ